MNITPYITIPALLRSGNFNLAVQKATVKALNSTAYEVMQETRASIPTWITGKHNHLQRGVVYDKATPTRHYAEVGFFDKLFLAPLLESGGKRLPYKGKVLAIPVRATKRERSFRGRTNAIQRLVKQKDVFSGTIKNTTGIWRRTGPRTLDLLYVFKDYTQYSKHFKFQKQARETYTKRYPYHYERHFADQINKLGR